MAQGYTGHVTINVANQATTVFQPDQGDAPDLVQAITLIAYRQNTGRIIVAPTEDVNISSTAPAGWWELQAEHTQYIRANPGELLDLRALWCMGDTIGDILQWVVWSGVKAAAERITV